MKRIREQPADPAMVFPRADPAALSGFDPSTKVCTMNCGPHRLDPRNDQERMYMCGDCLTTTQGDAMTTTAKDQEMAAFIAWAVKKYRQHAYRHTSATSGEWAAWQAAREGDSALLRQALDALEYHREQTRPIERTEVAIAALRTRLVEHNHANKA